MKSLSSSPSQSLKEQYILQISHFFDNPLGGFLINGKKFISINTPFIYFNKKKDVSIRS